MYEKESKALCYILRHGALKLKLNMQKTGHMFVVDVIDEMCKTFPRFNFATLEQIVNEDEKGRYSFNPTKLTIRANQGHSVPVDLGLAKKIPPVTLYHGTSESSIAAITKSGISKMKRHHVHLTDDPNTASSVGLRHGSEVLIEIDTREMVKAGIPFFQSDNGVWLTDYVDPMYFKEITHS